MKLEDFAKEHHLNFKNDIGDLILFFNSLDKMYLELTEEQAVALIKDYYANADDLFNDFQDTIKQGINEFFKMYQEEKEKTSNNDDLTDVTSDGEA